MFQFPAFAPAYRRCQAFSLTGCPIRTPTDLNLFAVPRRFSQLTTSFFASESLGILRPLFSCFLALVFCTLKLQSLIFLFHHDIPVMTIRLQTFVSSLPRYLSQYCQ